MFYDDVLIRLVWIITALNVLCVFAKTGFTLVFVGD